MRRAVLVIVLVLGCLATAPAMASDRPAEPPPAEAWLSGLEWAIAKAVTYEVGTSLLEAGLLVAVFGGGAAAAGGALLAVLATTSVVYVAHEYAWETVTPAALPRDDPELIGAKTLTYRVADTLRAFALGAGFGGAPMLASAAYTATLTVAELVLYAVNEVAFARLRHLAEAE